MLAASTLELVTAQRLLRRLCPACRVPADIDAAMVERLAPGLPADTVFHTSTGCGECTGVGYRGRVGVSEVLVFDEPLRRLVAEGAPADTLRAAAQERGCLASLRSNAMRKAARGLTSVEEVLRVAG